MLMVAMFDLVERGTPFSPGRLSRSGLPTRIVVGIFKLQKFSINYQWLTVGNSYMPVSFIIMVRPYL